MRQFNAWYHGIIMPIISEYQLKEDKTESARNSKCMMLRYCGAKFIILYYIHFEIIHK